MQALRLLLAGVAVPLFAGLCGQVNAAAPFFMGLGDLPGGSFDSRAYGVSADGSVVVGTGTSTSGNEAFRWTVGTGMVGLGGSSSAFDVSADGSIIVGQTGSWAMRWTQDTGMVNLGDFPGVPNYSFATAVSADGSVVVGLGSTNRPFGHGGRIPYYSAFRWTQGSGLVEADVGIRYDYPFRLALDVSADGQMLVGGFGDPHLGGAGEASRWTQAGGRVFLGDLPGGLVSGRAYAVSSDGTVIVGESSSDAGVESFRWTEQSGIVGLGILPGFEFSSAQDVSADGSIVIGSVGFETNTYAGAFIWDTVHGMRNLRNVLINDFGLGDTLAGWNLEYASAISADGRVVVGYGTNPNGDTEGWLARLPTAPTLPGDVNFDGVVDIFDVNIVSTYWGTSGPQGDANGDGMVDIFDVNVISAHWTPTGGATTPVPEPTALVLIGLCLAAVGIAEFCRRHGPRRRRWPLKSIVDRA